MTSRNQDAIKKTAAGMLKLLHPQMTADQVDVEKVKHLVSFAAEMRKRVIDQLAVMKPEEFSGVVLALD